MEMINFIDLVNELVSDSFHYSKNYYSFSILNGTGVFRSTNGNMSPLGRRLPDDCFSTDGAYIIWDRPYYIYNELPFTVEFGNYLVFVHNELGRLFEKNNVSNVNYRNIVQEVYSLAIDIAEEEVDYNTFATVISEKCAKILKELK